MKIRYLGTAAAEGWPALFCFCDSCKKAMAAGGRNIRTRSQTVIDEKLLIDFPADTYLHVLYNSLDLKNINTCILTHTHADHLYPIDFDMRKKAFAQLKDDAPFTVYGTEITSQYIRKTVNASALEKEGHVVLKTIQPFVPFDAAGYQITPLTANHDAQSGPVIYSISDGRRTLLYANDTGYFTDETWKYLESMKPRFHFVSLDCTMGTIDCRENHMGLKTNGEVRNHLNKIGCTDRKTVFCLTHFSHNSKAIYDEMVPIAGRQGFTVAYDGMAAEF